MTNPWRSLAVAMAVWAAAAGQTGRTPDPSSCQRYLPRPGQPAVECDQGLLFDAVSLTCLPAAEATCATDSDSPQAANRTVVRKCCPEQQQFSLTLGQCVDREGPFQLPFFAHEPFDASAPLPVDGVAYRIVAQQLTCEAFPLNTDAAQPDDLFLLDNGMLYVQAYRTLYTTEAYCLETMVTDDAGTARLGAAVCPEVDAPGVLPLSDDRVPIPRCCARFVPYDPLEGCRFDAALQGDEPLPPLDGGDPAVRAALDSAGFEASFRYEIVFPECNATDRLLLSMGDRPFSIGGDGTLTFRNGNVSVSPDSYCFNERVTGSSDERGAALASMAIVCSDPEVRAAVAAPAVPHCGAEPCLRKCCPPGHELLVTATANGASQMTCVLGGAPLELPRIGAVAPALYGAPIVYGQPACPGGLFEVEEGNYSVLASGAFRLIEYDEYACNNSAKFDANSSAYCLDTKRGSNRSAHAFYCYKEIEEDDTSAAYVFFPILMGITDFFLLVTFIVYLTVPDPTQTGLNKKRKLSQSVLGMILLAYISSLFFAYLVLMIVQTATSMLAQYRVVCKVLAVILYFFLLTAFFWLSVICCEIYITTRANKHISGRKRFRLYALYAWGLPLLMAMLALIMDLAPGIDNCSVIKPAFGRYRCLFQNRKAFIAYFYIPIGVLLTICLVLYILTVKNLSVPSKMPGRDASTANMSMSKQYAKQTGKRRKLCAKLFLIMGITWVAELLSYLIGDSVVWYFFDVINILQGFFIFVAFILRPKVLQYIKKTALQSLSRSFGHESQQDNGQPQGRGAGPTDQEPAGRAGQGCPSPMTMSTRATSGRGPGPAGEP
ncbi:uncharacterized protein LOC119102326 [Pollicipes pollicipes]|uniref:uncharacterized protein LOC119102326 n=1 Tax=Pollicipes pollicipes TaxID=41117 RepID=UPI0018854A3A|nr:uncharacterized protein LOC119102326 [Pollicipes pollicipes]